MAVGEPWFADGERVLIVGAHPWNGYAGVVLGDWPGPHMDWLVQLDNGQNIGVKTGDLRAANSQASLGQ